MLMMMTALVPITKTREYIIGKEDEDDDDDDYDDDDDGLRVF